nr:lipopolysaccharide biosynthesis chain length determinant protein [uncultured bacterium]
MQPTETFTVARRALDVEDYIDILRRHKGWIFGPFLLTLVASVVGVYLWPDKYESVAVVKIVQQQVPQNLVPSAITQDMADRINSMATTVLSRNVLTTIINNFDLYKSERKRLPMDDVIESYMKRDIHIEPIMTGAERSVPAFRVKFSYPERVLASKVVQDVTSRFISEQGTTRSAATIQTTQFMRDARDGAKKDLEELEQKLSEFRAANIGRLPDQVESNVRQLTALQTNYQFLTGSKNRADLEKLQIETNLRVEQARLTEFTKEPPPPTAAAAAAMKSDRLLEAERDIRNLEDRVSLTLQKYTEAHPDVQNLRSMLEIAKKRKEQVLKDEAENKAPAPTLVAANPQMRFQALDVQGNVQRLESSIRAKEIEIRDLEAQIKQVKSAMDRLEAQINAAPLGEQKYSDLLRERDLASAKYKELDGALDKAQLGQDLESRGQGERLELLDTASLPQYPTEPKRPQVIGIGAGIGLLLGIVIAAAREAKDTSLKNMKDVRAYTQMAILGSVPLLENDFVVRRRSRISWLGWTTACVMAAVTMAGSIVYYYTTKL